MRDAGSTKPPPSKPGLRALPGQASRLATGEEPVARADAAADQRRRILAATAELVGKRGYHGTTVELIIRRARVGTATFYRYFKGKEDVFLVLFDVSADRVVRQMTEAFTAHESISWADGLAAALRSFYNAIAAHPITARACLVEVLTAGPEAVAHYERSLAALHPVLRAGRRLNPRAAELPETLEATLAGGVLWIPYQRLVMGEAHRVPALLPETLEFVLTPYLGEDEAAREAARFNPLESEVGSS